MSFESILEVIVKECGGGLGVALMGTDGIPIAQISGPEAGDDPFGDDFAAAGVEFGNIIAGLCKTGDALGGGALQETTVGFTRFTVILRPIDDDVILALALSPQGNVGKARYLVRRHLNALRDEF